MTRLVLLLALLSAPGIGAQEQPFPALEELMSEEEYRAAGLAKLSPTERRALTQWLIRYTAYEAPTLRRDNDQVRQAEQELEINAYITPPFSGWTGDTVFQLDNGQVWKQRIKGRFRYQGQDTAVTIRKNFLGYFKMTHSASGRTIGVSRIK